MYNKNPWEEELRKLEEDNFDYEKDWLKITNPWEEELRKLEDMD